MRTIKFFALSLFLVSFFLVNTAEANSQKKSDLIFATDGCHYIIFSAKDGKTITEKTLLKGEEMLLPSIGATAVCVDNSNDSKGGVILRFAGK